MLDTFRYVNLSTGKLSVPITDAVIPSGRLAVVLRRTYNSSDFVDHGVGKGWRFNFQHTIADLGNNVYWTDGDGTTLLFVKQPDGSYTPEEQEFSILRKLAAGWEIQRKDGTLYHFDSGGRLTSTADRNGNQISYTLDGSGRVTTITPSLGAAWTLHYDATTGRLTDVVDGAGRTYMYGYNFYGQLVTQTDATGAITQYEYDGSFPLIRITDPEGRSGQVGYTNGRVTSYSDPIAGTPQTTRFAYDYRRTYVRDPQGNTASYSFDEDNRFTRASDSLKGLTTLEYDESGNLVKVTDPLNQETVLSGYDQWGNPGQVTDPLSNTVMYAYDPTLHLPIRITDPIGAVTVMEYDAKGNLIRSTVATGTSVEAVTEFTYDNRGLLTATVDPRGHGTANPAAYTTRYAYDSAGRLTTVTDPLGGSTVLSYDAAGNLISSVDPLGRETTFGYDLGGRRTLVELPDRYQQHYTYDTAGYLVRETDTAGASKLYSYDVSGRVTSITNPLGGVTTYEYDASGRPVSVTDPLGNRTRTTYDALGRPILSIDGEGNTTWNQCDAVGNILRTVLPSGYIVSAEYDALNRRVKTKVPPATTEVTYDALDRVTLAKDTSGHYTKYEYDQLGRLARVYDAANLDATGAPVANAKYTAYGYDAAGNKTDVTDARGYQTTYEFDADNRLVQQTNPLGEQDQFAYDAAGQLTKSINGQGDVINHTYDVRGRVASTWYDNGTRCETVTFTYDPEGRILGTKNQHGLTSYQYDAAGNLMAYKDPFGTQMQYRYDLAGNRVSMELLEGVWAYSYDRDNRLVGILDSKGNQTTYEYNVDGQRRRTNLPFGISMTNTFDSVTRRLIKQEYYKQGAANSVTFSYTYDTKGNVLTVGQSGQTTVTYTYDALDRLSSSTASPGTSYTYDANGNRLTMTQSGTTKSYTHDGANRLTQINQGTTVTDQYVYDAAGRLTKVTKNPNSSPVSEYYEYDGFGQLTKTTSGTKVTTYGYGATGERLYRKIVDRSNLSQSDAVYYQYANGQVIAERDGTGATMSTVTRGLGGELISLSRFEGDFVFITDRLGSVAQLVDSTMTVKNSYKYDDFGQVTSSTEAIRSDWKFTGSLFDASTSLYQLSSRYYRPADGRFLTQDTYKGNPWQPWTQNLYVYVGNNPVNMLDPTGHKAMNINEDGGGAGPLPEAWFVNGVSYAQGDPYPKNTVDALKERGIDAHWFKDYGEGALNDVVDFSSEISAYPNWQLTLALYQTYCSGGKGSQVRGGTCPEAPVFQGEKYSQSLAAAVTESLNGGPLHLIGYSGGGSVVLNATLLLVARGVKVTSISLFGAPADPSLIRAVKSLGVDINTYNTPGDWTGEADNALTAALGLVGQAAVNHNPHGTYFRSDLDDSMNMLLQWWGVNNP